MDYHISTSLPHFRESFSHPIDSNASLVTPLSASSLQAYNSSLHSYNAMNASMMANRKRKVCDPLPAHHYNHENQSILEIHEPKRLMLDRARPGHLYDHQHHHGALSYSGTRQRQESGCSVSSSSSWSSSASFSTVSSSPNALAIPDLSVSPPNRAMSSSPSSGTRSPSPFPETTVSIERNPLWFICEAIDLAAIAPVVTPTSSKRPSMPQSAWSSSPSSAFPPSSAHKQRGVDQGMEGIKIVVYEPNWVAEHIERTRKALALKRQGRP